MTSAPSRMSLWYTRKEWLYAFGLQWVAMRTGAFGVEEMSDDDQIENFGSVGAGLRWATRYLWAKGYRFQALRVDGNGRIWPTQKQPIEPANSLFLHKLSQNILPSPVVFCNVLLDLLDSRPDILVDRDPIHSVLEEAETDREAALAEWGDDPEYHRLAQEAFDNLMGSVGLVRREKLKEEN